MDENYGINLTETNTKSLLNKKSKRERNKEQYLKKWKEKKKQQKKNKNKKQEDSNLKYKMNKNNNHFDVIKSKNYEIEYVEDNNFDIPIQSEELIKVLNYFEIPKKKRPFEKDYENEQNEDFYDENDGDPSNTEKGKKVNKPKTSHKLRKKLEKQLSQIKLSNLKQMSKFPEVVESWDATAKDPKLLIFFKCLKNTVPVPKHWAQKRRYLQSQRGSLRPPFKLPEYIEATGISKIRNIEENNKKGLKQLLRQRMQPKLGRMDIDYSVLHNAFFKYQTKPRLSGLGDVYFEGKEFENKMRKFQPGKISAQLRTVLGISEKMIPPFVINMQRFGPPPSYPNLKIPWVNAPITDATEEEITKDLWDEPIIKEEKEWVWDFKNDWNHWGVIREDEEESDGDDEDMDQDIDDWEISDEDKADVTGLFDNNSNVTAIETERIMLANSNNPPFKPKSNTTFYDELKQTTSVGVKEGELHPVGFRYIVNSVDKENNSESIQTPLINKSETIHKNVKEDEEEDKDETLLNNKIF